MTQSKSSIDVDTTILRIGCFCAENVWLGLDHDLRRPTNTVALGRVRRSEISEILSVPHYTEMSKSDYNPDMKSET